MTTLLIDDDVPPPTPGTRVRSLGSRAIIFSAMRKMEIGHSLHIDCDKGSSGRARTSATICAKRLEIKITASYVGEHDPRGPGLRVWRLS